MKKEIVWRVQNEFGCGPYNGTGNILSLLKALEKSGRLIPGVRPSPWHDTGLKNKFNYACLNPKSLCGFSNLEQYERWFNTREIRDLLHNTGFYLVKYEVSSAVWHGETQALFFGDDAVPVGFRACNKSGVFNKKADLPKPVKRFLRLKKANRFKETRA